MTETWSLYLIRHAIAAERGEKFPDDALRPLTPEGAGKMRFGARGFGAMGVELDVLISSPLIRALSTAEIVQRGLSRRPKVLSAPALAPGGTPVKLGDTLAKFGEHHSLGLVGHEPDLGRFAAWLIGAAQPLPLKKGGACRIDLADWPPAPKQGTLVWFATPKMLRSLD